MNEVRTKLSGPRVWVAYTLFAAALGAILFYLQHDRSQAQKHYEVGTSYMIFMHEPTGKERAMRHLRLAAEQGHTDAQRVLGTIYLEDIEDEENADDAEAARRWLEMAANGGDAEAQASLRRLPSSELEGPAVE